MRTALFLLVGLSGLLLACNDSRPSSADAGGIVLMVDAGPRRDAGRDSGGAADSGVDPCRADEPEAELTLACNGGIYGSTQRDNEINGECTPDASEGPGSCFRPAGGTMPYCIDLGDGPICVIECPTTTYVSTGGCPRGSRCFEFDDGVGGLGECYRDCFGNSDCFAGEECDPEGSCVPR